MWIDGWMDAERDREREKTRIDLWISEDVCHIMNVYVMLCHRRVCVLDRATKGALYSIWSVMG